MSKPHESLCRTFSAREAVSLGLAECLAAHLHLPSAHVWHWLHRWFRFCEPPCRHTYTVDEKQKTITIYHVRHRKEVYR